MVTRDDTGIARGGAHAANVVGGALDDAGDDGTAAVHVDFVAGPARAGADNRWLQCGTSTREEQCRVVMLQTSGTTRANATAWTARTAWSRAGRRLWKNTPLSSTSLPNGAVRHTRKLQGG